MCRLRRIGEQQQCSEHWGLQVEAPEVPLETKSDGCPVSSTCFFIRFLHAASSSEFFWKTHSVALYNNKKAWTWLDAAILWYYLTLISVDDKLYWKRKPKEGKDLFLNEVPTQGTDWVGRSRSNKDRATHKIPISDFF